MPGTPASDGLIVACQNARPNPLFCSTQFTKGARTSVIRAQVKPLLHALHSNPSATYNVPRTRTTL